MTIPSKDRQQILIPLTNKSRLLISRLQFPLVTMVLSLKNFGTGLQGMRVDASKGKLTKTRIIMARVKLGVFAGVKSRNPTIHNNGTAV